MTVTRLEPDRFYVVSAAATEKHDYAWLEGHLPDDGSVRLDNVTERYGVLTLAGPRSRELLQAADRGRRLARGVPVLPRRGSSRSAGLPTLALRVSYVGELGFELHHPVEHQRALYERLLEAGEPLGLVDFGYRALESMRLEKAYRLWGVRHVRRLDAARGGPRAVRRASTRATSSAATRCCASVTRASRRTLACLAVETEDADPHGYEPVRADGTPIGYVASGGYGHVVEQSIALAYLPVEHAEPGTRADGRHPRRAASRRSSCRSRSTIRENERLLS